MSVVFFSLSAILITGCDKEEEDLIPHPSDTSTILTGQIATPDGMPLADIPVSVDYTFKSIFGTSLIHKAKGCTDKSGFYKIFFEFQEDGITDFRSSLVFSVDLSTLPADDYYIATKLDYHSLLIMNGWVKTLIAPSQYLVRRMQRSLSITGEIALRRVIMP